MSKNLPSILIQLADTFEFELLVRLILEHWEHPYALDAEYNNDVVESAVEVLRCSETGEQLIKSVPPDQMNLVAAVWYVEFVTDAANIDPEVSIQRARRQSLDNVRRSLPSCFCDFDELSDMA